MYIEKLILENYASIAVALKAKRIEIDFSNRRNRICLLCAPNGGGKTSILSAMTPFATLGNLDVRDSLPIIQVGKKGYKEIIIRDGKTRYAIKHYYTPNGDKGTHSVKSYIEKDGTELNPNGNVSSFKEIVNQELDIEMDYLKLVRLGNNVTNLLDLKTTERKNFMSKLLDDVDIYLKYNKKISKDLLETKTIINHTLDKVKKTGIEDLREYDDATKELEKELKKKKSELESLIASISVSENELSSYGDKKEKEERSKTLRKKLEKSSSVDSRTLEDVQKDIEDTKNALTKFDKRQAVLSALRETKTEELEGLLKDRDNTQLEYEKEVQSENVKSYKKIIRELSLTVESYEVKFKDQEFSYTKEDLEKFGSLVKQIDGILETTYSFGQEPVSRVIKLMKDGIKIDEYTQTEIGKLRQNEYENACRIVFQKFKKKYDDLPGCKFGDGSCPYVEFYNEMSDSSVEREEKRQEESISLLESMVLVYQNIQTIFSMFHKEKELFNKMPKEIQDEFQLDYFMDRIDSLKSVYNQDLFFSLLSEITEYTNYLEAKKELDETKANLETALNSSHVKSLEKSLSTISEKIKRVKDEVSNADEELENLDRHIHFLNEKLLDREAEAEVLEHYDAMKAEYDGLMKELEEIYKVQMNLSLAKGRRLTLEPAISQLEKTIQFRNYSMKDYAKLQEDLKKYQDVYDDLDAIRYATSTKEGIPLFYIQMYLKDTREVTNELLDQVYGGRLYIEDFKINADEFRIPFVRDGVEIKDASFASQGELSFLSIALSFALSAQSLTRYNIILLDEIDGALDTKNREHFISILEYLLEMIHAEQVFVITHNNMFDMYPVDIINTNGSMDSPSQLGNVIPVKLE